MSELNKNPGLPCHYPYIILGGGIAGVTCAEHLYILHPEKEILLITASNVVKAATNIQHLTKTLDCFDVEERPFDQFSATCPSVTVQKDVVESLNSCDQIILTSSGKCYSYDKVCICTGAIPNVISPQNPFVVWIRDVESVVQFQSRISNAKRIVIVGNGGIATEMVYGLKGVDVVWAIKDKSINAVFIDPGAAQFLLPRLNDQKKEEKIVKRKRYVIDGSEASSSSNIVGGALGPDWQAGFELSGDGTHSNVVIEKEVKVVDVKITDGEWPVHIKLSNGKDYGCDLIVSATGVTPNKDVFMKGNNFELGSDGGLLVDDHMRTNIKDVFAAGDVCTCGWDISKHWMQMRLWTQARQMGSFAAKCMWSSYVGEEIYTDFCFELFTHATKFFGHKVVLLGLFNGQKLDSKYEILLRMTKGVEYIKCIMVDGRMQGAILLGETNMEETLENLILNQMDLSIYGEDLLNPDVDIEDYFD